jgi:hypothetical protein
MLKEAGLPQPLSFSTPPANPVTILARFTSQDTKKVPWETI